jgi:hypothetical protein
MSKWSNALPNCSAGKMVAVIVPPDCALMSEAHASIAVCSGCEGGTQCESFNCTVASAAREGAAPKAMAAANTHKPVQSADKILADRLAATWRIDVIPHQNPA